MSASIPPIPQMAASQPAVATEEEVLVHLNRNGHDRDGESEKSLWRPATLRKLFAKEVARRTVGMILLLVTVFLWIASAFLASTLFADHTYSKPYLVTYINSSFFTISLPFLAIKGLWKKSNRFIKQFMKRGNKSVQYSLLQREEDVVTTKVSGSISESATNRDLSTDNRPGDRLGSSHGTKPSTDVDILDLRQTAWLGLEFSFLWFLANYFMSACLEYTTVASSTILGSTSSIWCLIFGALMRVERFTIRKLLGVLASLFGIILISSVDLSGENDSSRGTFPHKSHRQLAVGDALAFLAAVMYGIYTTVMKKRIGDESRINLPLFFGFVGLSNMILLSPGFLILHFTGVERFELPPTNRVWTIILVNSLTSLISDYTWAYAMLLTSPLIITVGMSLTIPFSLVAQMIVNHQNSSVLYWIGAVTTLLAFLGVSHESRTEGDDGAQGDGREPERVEDG